MRPGGLWHRDTRPRRWLITVATEIARIPRTPPRGAIAHGRGRFPGEIRCRSRMARQIRGGTGISLDI